MYITICTQKPITIYGQVQTRTLVSDVAILYIWERLCFVTAWRALNFIDHISTPRFSSKGTHCISHLDSEMGHQQNTLHVTALIV